MHAQIFAPNPDGTLGLVSRSCMSRGGREAHQRHDEETEFIRACPTFSSPSSLSSVQFRSTPVVRNVPAFDGHPFRSRPPESVPYLPVTPRPRCLWVPPRLHWTGSRRPVPYSVAARGVLDLLRVSGRHVNMFVSTECGRAARWTDLLFLSTTTSSSEQNGWRMRKSTLTCRCTSEQLI
jgi:hypothetical protein